MPAHVSALIAEYARPPARSVWVVSVWCDGTNGTPSAFVFDNQEDAEEYCDELDGDNEGDDNDSSQVTNVEECQINYSAKIEESEKWRNKAGR